MASSARNLVGFAIVMTVIMGAFLGLGIWQIERLGQKSELLNRIDQRIAGTAVALPPEDQWSQTDLDYLKVTVSGSFRHDLEAYLFGVIDKNDRGDNVPGFFVLTPLILDNGATLIVNRGFVPQDKKDPMLRIEGQVQGRVTVTGLLRLPERKTLFTPEADRNARVMYARDPALIAQWSNLSRVAPFWIDADATPNVGGLPTGGLTVVSVPNNHLQYALTWFALACVTGGMFVAYALKQHKDSAE